MQNTEKKKFIIFILLFIVFISVFLFLLFLNFFNKDKKNNVIENVTVKNEIKKDISKNCEDGYILVPGNPLYKTSDFCIMKYEAKCAYISAPDIGLEPARNDACYGHKNGHYFNTYDNAGVNCSCTAEFSKEVVSTKSGLPIAYITESDNTKNNAKKYCENIGGHLITNNEWMTIARDVEKNPLNWCDKNGTNCNFAPGTKGKILANGHNDNQDEKISNGTGTDNALVAGNDSEPCFETTTDGSNTCGGKSSQKRTLNLTNGETIWDFAGNVWEWTDNVVMRKDEPKSASLGKIDSGWLKSDFAPGSLNSVITDNGQGPSLGYDAFRPSNPAWNTNNGVGRIYHYSTPGIDTDTTLYSFIRGGNWKHGDDDGAFTIHLSPPPDRPLINDVGFRCVK